MEHPGTEQVYRGDILRLLAKITKDRGFDLTQYRQAYVERRVAARLRALNLHTYRQYAHVLDRDPDEYAKLLDTLTINVTDFFRDPPVYAMFRQQVIPDILDHKLKTRHRMIRVWSAGCATGEEPYSLAMAFLDALGPNKAAFMLSVVGTDLDPEALAKAQRATYDAAALSHIPATDQARFILPKGDKFQISPEVTRHVKFRRLNLFSDEPIHMVDVIFCRNVFIYFTREQQAKVLEVFARSLAKNGYLVLGRSEKLATGLNEKFDTVSGRDRIYRKRGDARSSGTP